jgi:dephospho-CoA kinase
MPGSGKEEFVNIAREKGFSVVRMGDVVRTEVKNRGLELSSENVGRVANEERQKHGLGIWAERTLPLISGDTILIDGIRGDEELEIFKGALNQDLILIGIHTSPKLRFDRIRSRARSDATMTWEEFQERDLRELGWGIGNAMALCEHMIINEGTLEEYKDKIRSILKALKED